MQLLTSGVRRHATVLQETRHCEPNYCRGGSRSAAVTGPMYVTLKATCCFDEARIGGGFDEVVLHDGRA